MCSPELDYFFSVVEYLATSTEATPYLSQLGVLSERVSMDAQSLAGLVNAISSIEVYIRLYRYHSRKASLFGDN
jgi:hypothetical protein